MTLSEYMAQHSLSDADMAALIGLHRGQVSKLRRGKSKPSWEKIPLIVQVTNGAVTAEDFLVVKEAA